MAVDYGLAIGLDGSDLLLALLMTQFIDFYNMLGNFAAVPEPLMIGLIAAMSGSSRLAMLSVSILFISGGILLYFVNEKKAVQVAEDIDTL